MSRERKPPVRYAGDKPQECEYCYFWAGKRNGCELGGGAHCYYIDRSSKEPKSRCNGCPYGRASPCIGWCTVQVMEEVLGKQNEGRGSGPGEEVTGDAGDPH